MNSKIKYIFCISTGRCGTDYLASLFGSLRQTSAYHEQIPLLHNDIMRAYLKGNKKPLQHTFPEKMKTIHLDHGNLYVDTSHIFIKSFGWEIPNHIPHEEIGVVILKRDREKVAQSTQRVHSGPFSYLGRKWIIVPNGNNCISPPISYGVYTIYRMLLKCYWFLIQAPIINKPYPKFFLKKSLSLLRWYYDETYALAKKYRSLYPKLTYIDVTLEELNTVEGFENLIYGFGLSSYYDSTEVEKKIGKPKNLKKEL